jgi:hypothetical protein
MIGFLMGYCYYFGILSRLENWTYSGRFKKVAMALNYRGVFCFAYLLVVEMLIWLLESANRAL